MKYDIGSILSIVQSNSININLLMINKNTSAKNVIDLDNIFPIKNQEELESLETKIKADENFKNILVLYLIIISLNYPMLYNYLAKYIYFQVTLLSV